MDKITEYLNIKRWIEADLERSASALQQLREELFRPLSAEKAGGYQVTPTEVLRNYIKVSREIQKVLFDKISTHVLTIEHLADHVLCRRAYAEKNNKKPVIKEPPPTDIVQKLLAFADNMSDEEIENYLKSEREKLEKQGTKPTGSN